MYLLQQENLFDEQSSAGEGDHRTRQLESAHAHTCNLFILIKLCSVCILYCGKDERNKVLSAMWCLL